MMRETIYLEARLYQPYVARFYWIDVGSNLFGQFQLLINYGRLGTGGQVRRFIFEDFAALTSKFNQILKKRLTAKRRLGCCYRLIETSLEVNHPLFIYLQPFIENDDLVTPLA